MLIVWSIYCTFSFIWNNCFELSRKMCNHTIDFSHLSNLKHIFRYLFRNYLQRMYEGEGVGASVRFDRPWKILFSLNLPAFESFLKCLVQFTMKFSLNGRKSVANSSKIVQSLSIKTHQEKPRRGVWPQLKFLLSLMLLLLLGRCIWQARFGDCHRYGCALCRLRVRQLYRDFDPRHRAPPLPFCRCSQSAAGSDNCQLGAILQCDSSRDNDNNNMGNGQKKTSSFVSICLPRSGFLGVARGEDQRLCACLRTFPMQFHCTTHSITVARKSMQQSLANGAALLFSHCSFDEHPGSGYIYGNGGFSLPCCVDCGYAGDAHLKTTIINCLYLPGYWKTTYTTL